jgi:phosphonate degradation associated HDIG domain protein
MSRHELRSSGPHIVEKIAELFQRKGNSLYGGEQVTQEEHALQAAKLAEESGAPPATIAAALLHDVGHLLHNLPDDAPDDGVDDVHEALGYRFLSRWFGPEVAEPVRMHVAAKRYLCAVDPAYLATLSPPSVQSLGLQGGPMTPSEVTAYEELPYYAESLVVRRWDDLAKDPTLKTPPLAHYLPYLREVLTTPTAAEATP